MTDTTLYTITLEKADSWAFSGAIALTCNCLALPRKPRVETQVRYAGGGGRNEWTDEFHLELYPFSTVFSSSEQHSGDVDELIAFLDDSKPLRIKSLDLPRYTSGAGGIPARKTFIENCPVFLTSLELNLEKDSAEETVTIVLERVKR